MTHKRPPTHRPVVLIILDGWGVALPSQANAITLAQTPHFDHYVTTYPTFTLQASGEAAGLPWGEVGNSEVGHMCIGAGRIVYQELSRINASIADGSFFKNEVLRAACAHAKKNKSTLHLIGLVSSGGVHSHSDHLSALVEMAKKMRVPQIAIHAILDGRDTPYASGEQIIAKLQSSLVSFRGVRVASLVGRFYAMDRDNHWDREEKVYRMLVEGSANALDADPCGAIRKSYEKKIYDEEFAPTLIIGADGSTQCIKENDAVIFFNIRADRARQLATLFLDSSFSRFPVKQFKNLFFATLTQYDERLAAPVAFPPQHIVNCLAETISKYGYRQLHIAETEKYAHITYFLNGGREEPLTGEEHILLPSPSVNTYDKKPEMSARDITSTLVKEIARDAFDYIAVNFANADMVAHTGNLKATIKAIETIDQCFQSIVPAVLAKDGALVITADHGNAETLIDLKKGTIDKEHNTSPVPCIIIAREFEGKTLDQADVSQKDLSVLEPSGLLSDVAPTLLDLCGIPIPSEMTGKSLIASF